MDEVTKQTPGNPQSNVFPGQVSTDFEYLIQTLSGKGMRIVRVSFDPFCTDTTDFNFMSVYSLQNAQLVLQIATHYNFTVILDYHGYTDIFQNVTCWLNYWKPIVQNVGPISPNIIWEPENEPEYSSCTNSPVNCSSVMPCNTDLTCVTTLSASYQQWIQQARSLGDTHYIVVQNLCSYGCGQITPNGDCNGSSAANGYPTVTDTIGKIYISLHSYMDYSQYSSTWTNSTADAVAQGCLQGVLAGVQKTGWKALNTEGGTDPLNSAAPGFIATGSAGYTPVTLEFIRKLTQLYDAQTPPIGHLWWTAGDWTDTPGSGVLGALNCSNNPIGWGCYLPGYSLTTTPPTGTVNLTYSPLVTAGVLTAILGSVVGAVIYTRRKR